MTVSSDLSRVQYNAPGGSTDYAVGFKFFAKADLVVLVTVGGVDATQVLDTDYTVTLNPDRTGTVTGSFTTGGLVTIYRDLPFTQETEFAEGDELPAGSLNDLADRLVMMMQQLLSTVGRAIVLSASSTLSGLTFPAAVAGKFLRWNASADGFENADLESLGAIGIPVAIADGGTGQITAAAAWAALLQKASAAELLAATDDTKAVTALRLQQTLIAARLAQFTLSR